jgi:hypothetical protein
LLIEPLNLVHLGNAGILADALLLADLIRLLDELGAALLDGVLLGLVG